VRPNLREHQANERTFLAWLRTSIAIIAFGFVLERFSLFLKYLAPASAANVANPHTSLVGVGLIWLGTLMIPVSLWRFLIEERHIDRATPTTSGNWPLIILAILLAAVGIYLALAVTM
jgi:putative membrane protein